MVSSADMASTSGLCSLTACRNLETVTSNPRSMTSKPANSKNSAIRFLPMSWMSPSTVPMMILWFWALWRGMGFTTCRPALMAREASRTSGTQKSSPSKSSVARLMAGMMAARRISSALMLFLMPALMNLTTSFACPLMMADVISLRMRLRFNSTGNAPAFVLWQLFSSVTMPPLEALERITLITLY